MDVFVAAKNGGQIFENSWCFSIKN
jgi:hypothetical protein